MEQRVELLAPAGNYETFLGAIKAGADAVYLAGQRFGARAYAGNFSEEELLRALDYAHLFGKRIYLTLNTLVKEKEFDDIYDFLKPLNDAGLDGIIVQDVGVMKYVRETFKDIPLHISTQAFVTGPESARFFKKLGAVRVVPARELSLEEIIDIKNIGIEVETFIHGAMCYSYSGQCLFSSVVGGRSGNRGRCAGPCRLPYGFSIDGKACFKGENYPISLKDLCTIYDLDKLIAAGIDSFKIEGRMKKPEYAAGVVSIYRKYIDKYYENPGAAYTVSKEDDRLLHSLYIRSEVMDGYYFRHNGKEMISMDSPAYTETGEAVLLDIKAKYLDKPMKLPVDMSARCHVGEPLSLTVTYKDTVITEKSQVLIEESQNRPATKEDILKNLTKLGNTDFTAGNVEIELGDNCFVPVKVINDLRRLAFTRLSATIKDAILLQRKNRLKQDE